MPTLNEIAPYLSVAMIVVTLLFIAHRARNAWWTQESSIAPPPPARPASPDPTEETIWKAAKAIHDTGDITMTVWPEYEGDDGRRVFEDGDIGYLRLADDRDIAEFQEAARAAIEVYRKQLLWN